MLTTTGWMWCIGRTSKKGHKYENKNKTTAPGCTSVSLVNKELYGVLQIHQHAARLEAHGSVRNLALEHRLFNEQPHSLFEPLIRKAFRLMSDSLVIKFPRRELPQRHS